MLSNFLAKTQTHLLFKPATAFLSGAAGVLLAHCVYRYTILRGEVASAALVGIAPATEQEIWRQVAETALGDASLFLLVLMVALAWLWRANKALGDAAAALQHLVAEDPDIRPPDGRRRDGAGGVAHLLLSCRDAVLRHRRAEADLRIMLAEREALIDNARVGILSERDGIILGCNRYLEELLGYRGGELPGKPHRLLYASHTACESGDEAIARREQEGHSCCDEVLMRRKSGAVFRAVRRPGFDHGGDTAMGQRTWTYVEVGEALADSGKDRGGDETVAVAQDFRAPGRLVAGGRHRLGGAAFPTGCETDDGRRATYAGHAVLGLGCGTETGEGQLEHVPFRLDDMMGGIGTLMSIKAEVKGVELVLDIDPGLPASFVGDPLCLAQVLSDLVGSAIKQSRRGHVVISVRERLRRGTKMELLFSVLQATGSRPEQPGSVSGGQAGTKDGDSGNAGLGLAICRRLVEIMGGTLWTESLPARDSIIHFTALLAMAEQGGLAAPDYVDRLKIFADRRVLVIDDDPASRAVTGTLLARLGFVPELFDSARKALARLATRKPSDYLFCCIDWIMPDLDGFQVARLLRAHYGRACPPLLLLSAFSHVRGLRGVEREFATVVSKPFTLEQLSFHIASVLPDTAVAQPAAPGISDPELAARLEGKRVLLVGQAEEGQEIMADLLRQAGLRLRLAGNGVEALQAVREEVPDCIFMDCLMPVMDGLEATARLRAQGYGRLPIIGLAANARSRDRASCLAAGMNDVIGKPASASVLLAVLAKGAAQEAVGTAGAGSLIPSPAGDEILPPLPAGLDVEGGLRRLQGRTALFLKALRMFRDSRGHQFQLELRAAVAGQDWLTSERLAHGLIGTAASIGAHGVSAAAARLEFAIQAGHFGEVPALLVDVTEKLQAIVDGLAHIG